MTEANQAERILWAVGDDADRIHTDQGEALSAYVDEDPPTPKPGDTVRLCEYRPLQLPDSWRDALPGFLDDAYDRLGADYGDEDDCSPEPTEAVTDAMNALWATIRREYRVRRGAPTGRFETVDFHQWCMENAPEIFDGACVHCGYQIERPGGQPCPGRDDPGGPCETHPELAGEPHTGVRDSFDIANPRRKPAP
jgi:hypothetical protein